MLGAKRFLGDSDRAFVERLCAREIPLRRKRAVIRGSIAPTRTHLVLQQQSEVVEPRVRMLGAERFHADSDRAFVERLSSREIPLRAEESGDSRLDRADENALGLSAAERSC